MILDEFIQIIDEHERPCSIEYWKYPTISDKMIEDTMRSCECVEFVKLSARSGDNMNGLQNAIMKTQIGKDEIPGLNEIHFSMYSLYHIKNQCFVGIV